MILQRPLIHPNQRFDLEEWNALLTALKTDSKYWQKNFNSATSYIVSGFTISDSYLGQTNLQVVVAGSLLLNPDNTTDFSWFAGADGASAITVEVGVGGLIVGRNYLELDLTSTSGTPLQRVFWDKTSASEFSQEVNTTTVTGASVVVNQTSFNTSNKDRLPLAIVDVEAGGTISGILDRRNLFFRLGSPANPYANFSWASQTEPVTTLNFTIASSPAFTAGETVTFTGGATATVVTGGTTSITVKGFSNTNFALGDTVVGGTSGGSSTLDTFYEEFEGADKDVSSLKEMLDAIMTEIKAIKGTSSWFETGGTSSLPRLQDFVNAMLVNNTGGTLRGQFYWTGGSGSVSITDNTTSGWTSGDNIARIVVPGKAGIFNLKRMDGNGGTSTIALAQGSLLYVTLPSDLSTNRDFSGSGTGTTNYKTATLASFVPSDRDFIICYNQFGVLYFPKIGFIAANQRLNLEDYSAFTRKVLAVSGNTTLTNEDGVGLVNVTTGSSTITVTIPAAAAANTSRIITFKKVDSGVGQVVISGTVDGTANPTLTLQNSTCTIQSSGSAWLFVKESLEGVGSGAGELNVIRESNYAAGGWVASGAGITVATTTSASDLPLSGVISTAIKITPVSSTDYVRYRWTMPEALKNKKLKLEWHQRPLSGYTDGDLKVEVYKNSASDYLGSYTEFSLSTDSSGTSSIPNATGKYTTTFDADDADYYELRIVRTAGTTALNIVNVICGPGTQPQGAVVEEWKSFTPTGAFSGGNVTYTGKYRRVGDSMEVVAQVIMSGAPTDAGDGLFDLPSGFTIDTSKLPGTLTTVESQVVGKATAFDVGNESYPLNVVYASPTEVGLRSLDASTSSLTGGNLVSATVPFTFGSPDTIEYSFNVPIAEWAGSGTVNVAQNDVEYVSNSSSTDAADTTSFVYGPAGSAGVIATTTLTASRAKRVRFKTPIQQTDQIVVEMYDINNGVWEPITNCSQGSLSYVLQNTTEYGIYLSGVNSTDVDVIFGRYAVTSGATYASAGTNWSSLASGIKWRVKKCAGGQAVGFGNATSDSKGLITTFVHTVKSRINTVSSANYSITDTDGYDTILVSTGASQRTITLPAAATNNGRKLTIKKTDSGVGTILIDTPGSETIDGASQNSITQRYAFVVLECDGSNWQVTAVGGDYLEGIATAVAGGADNVGKAVSSVSLTEGLWLVDAQVQYVSNNTTATANVNSGIDISSTANSGAGTSAYSQIGLQLIAANNGVSLGIAIIPGVKIRVTSPTTYYLNATARYSGTAPNLYGSIKATRIG
jgi:hypothetical protein